MLNIAFRQTRSIVGKWRRRARSRRELAILGGLSDTTWRTGSI
jgi:uncharacterized protein YjiS (DUF1127 family)